MDLKAGIKHWLEIAQMAVVCLWQEIKGEEPDCPYCWKCEMMRVMLLCSGAGVLTFVVKKVLTTAL